MADFKRPRLSIARAQRKVPLSLWKKAIRLFRSPGVPKATYRANARKWVAANQALGDRHVLRGGAAKWGQPGDPGIEQVFAPRRYGEK